jgi:hypothetical protein
VSNDIRPEKMEPEAIASFRRRWMDTFRGSAKEPATIKQSPPDGFLQEWLVEAIESDLA